MSENISPNSEDMTFDRTSVAQISGGAMLRQAREAEGLHIAALAVLLKVPVKKLDALETDRFDLLPDVVFVRALAASVCRTLKIDPAPILERLPHTMAPRLKTDESGINTPFRVAGDGAGFLSWSQLSKPFVLAVLLLLVGVAALVLLPFIQRAGLGSVPGSEATGAIVSLPTLAPMISENALPAEAVAASQEPALPPASADAPLAVRPASAASSSVLPVMVPGSDATTGLIVFKSRGVSWVEAVDAGGVVQVRKTMTNGETVGASGVMPLSVVVGRADTIEVQVRGRPFDLTRIAKDNVARFEVK
ncbi:MAG: RodZ domain-containing protein [Rhodoferax sp.]